MKQLLAVFRNNVYFLIILFFVSLSIRLLYVLNIPIDKLSPDAFDWISVAERIVEGKGFDSFRPPGYAYFMALFFYLFGKSIVLIRIIQALIGSITCILIFLTAARLFNIYVARVSSVLICFYPYLIAYTGDLLSETFLTFMIALAVYAIVVCADNPVTKNAIAAGVLMGLAALTKSTIVPFFMFACIWLWWNTKSFKTVFLAGIFVVLTVAPWSLKNSLSSGSVAPVSTPWLTLYGSACDEALYLESLKGADVPLDDALNEPSHSKDWEYVNSLPPKERDIYCKDKALNWLKKNPDKLAYLAYKRVIHFWRLYPVFAYKWQKRMAMVTSGVYIPLCFIGIVLSYKQIKRLSLLVGLFAAYTLVHMFFTVTLRYRIPIDPYIIIYASYSIYLLFTAITRSRNKITNIRNQNIG